MLVADLRTDARQRDVDGLVLECVLEGGGLHLGVALVEHALDQLAHLVGALAHDGAILGGELAHHAHQAGDAALAAEQRDARGLELLGVVGACDELLGLFLEFDQIINQTHVFPFVSRALRLPRRLPPPDAYGCAARFGNKKTVLGHVHCPRTVEFRGTTLFDAADVSPAVPTLRPLSRGSRLPYWGHRRRWPRAR